MLNADLCRPMLTYAGLSDTGPQTADISKWIVEQAPGLWIAEQY